MARLENWGTVAREILPGPGIFGQALTGQVYDHPSGAFADGEIVTTSVIQGVKVEGYTLEATTKSGTKYILGAPAAEYELAYPDCKERLLAAWKKEEDHA